MTGDFIQYLDDRWMVDRSYMTGDFTRCLDDRWLVTRAWCLLKLINNDRWLVDRRLVPGGLRLYWVLTALIKMPTNVSYPWQYSPVGWCPISKELLYNPKGLTSSLLISFSAIEIFSQLIVIRKIPIIVQLLQIASINILEQKEQVKYLRYNAQLPNRTEHKRWANKYESRENVWRNLTINNNKKLKINKQKVIRFSVKGMRKEHKKEKD